MSRPSLAAPRCRPLHFEEQLTDVRGIPLHSFGPVGEGGVPIVLVHGLVVSNRYWRPLALELSCYGQVEAVDLPGFGRSARPSLTFSISDFARYLSEWLDARRIVRCHLIAHSMGAQVAAHVALQSPSRLFSLTLIGPTIDRAAPRWWEQGIRLLRGLARENVSMLRIVLGDFFRAGLPHTLGTVRRMFADSITEQVGGIETPTLVLRGERDPIAPMRWVEDLARLMPAAQAQVIPGGSHCVHYSHPKETAAAIHHWMRATAL